MPNRLQLIKEFLRPASVPPRGVPAMDAGLTPNDLLLDFDVAHQGNGFAPEDVLLTQDALHATDANTLVRIEHEGATVVATFGGQALGIAAGPAGQIFVCVDGVGLVRVHRDGTIETVLDARAQGLGPLSAVVLHAGAVFVTEVASADQVSTWSQWPRDLMQKGSSGRVLRVHEDGTVRIVADGLAWPYGLAVREGALLVSESWRHRIIQVSPDHGTTTVIADRLPAYPARLHATDDAEVAVAFFAARNNLVELVLREDEFRREMMETISMNDWIRPALSSTRSVREPLQIGAIVNLGEVKPWAPPRSYGLVATLDRSGELVASRHARPGSDRHGTTAYARLGRTEVVTSHAAGAVLVFHREANR